MSTFMNKRSVPLTFACLGTILFSVSAQERSPSPSSVSPDKKWEYKCVAYYDSECSPQMVKAGTTEVVMNLGQDLEVSGSESGDAQIFWAPHSKRFAFNYSPVHAHHTQFETVAFYQLNADKWVQLPSPVEETERSQLAELARKHLLKGFNPHTCAPDRDILKVRRWTDANTAILYAPCYGHSSDLKTAFLFTLKFYDAGNWKIIKTHQISKKELEQEQRNETRN
jgi:hypothetical protein